MRLGILSVVAFLVSSTLSGFAQTPTPVAGLSKSDNWVRVQSDDGEFSIDVPEKFRFYANEKGFIQNSDSNEYELKNMRMVNSYHDGTLISFEIYKGKNAILDEFYSNDAERKLPIKATEFKNKDHTVRQLTTTTDKSFMIRQYFSSKSNIYILTASSRGQETETMKRYFKSLRFQPGLVKAIDKEGVLLSKLPITDVVVEQILEEKESKPAEVNPKTDPPKDDDFVPALVVLKPKPSYTTPARYNGVKGMNRFKITMTDEGFVSRISILGRALPQGLLRQSLFAAIRLKFLPKEKRGIPETSTINVEYSFSLY